MKPIEELPSGRGPSDRTRREVQHHTARTTIEAAQRAVRDGTAGDFERDLILTLANVDAFEFGGGRAHELRRKSQEQIARWTAEDAEARAEAELRRHVQASPEIEATASEFLARFTPPSQEKP